MSDDYVYLKVKLMLKPGNTEEDVLKIVEDVDYSFKHDQITDHEIIDIHDINLVPVYDAPTPNGRKRLSALLDRMKVN